MQQQAIKLEKVRFNPLLANYFPSGQNAEQPLWDTNDKQLIARWWVILIRQNYTRHIFLSSNVCNQLDFFIGSWRHWKFWLLLQGILLLTYFQPLLMVKMQQQDVPLIRTGLLKMSTLGLLWKILHVAKARMKMKKMHIGYRTLSAI